MPQPEAIRTGLEQVERRIAAACARAGRARHEVTLVAVSKTFPAEAVTAAIAAGATDIGENRVQEARDKKPLVTAAARWHLIGHLQSNKAREAVRLFDLIHTVDTLDLAERISRFASSAGKRQLAFVEVNIGREPQKSGADPDQIANLVQACAGLEGIEVRGLMTIPPAGEPEEMRPYFRELRRLRDEARLRDLSMGMTDDFEVAIEEGATVIRVGRAIFGSRG